MPIGILTNVAVVAIAGIIGGLLGKYLPRRIFDSLIYIFGFCSIATVSATVTKMNSLPVVVMSLILGTLIGELIQLDDGISNLVSKSVGSVVDLKDPARANMIGNLVAIVCFSGTGIFGAIVEGLDGDSSILLTKSILDFFSIPIFAAEIGIISAVFALPQACIYALLFGISTFLAPILTAGTVNNFRAVGGVITYILGYNMIGSRCGWKKVKVLNSVPSMAVVLLISWLVEYFELPL